MRHVTMLAGAVVVLCLASTTRTCGQPRNTGASILARADEYFRALRFEDAIRLYSEAAAAGNAAAKVKLDGMMNIQPGEKVAPDLVKDAATICRPGESCNVCEQVPFFRRAADMGNTRAAVTLAHLFFYGPPLFCRTPEYPKTFTDRAHEAVRLCLSAAEAGSTEAMLELSRAYTSGTGVPKDPAEARRWLELAADRGSVAAEKQLRKPN